MMGNLELEVKIHFLLIYVGSLLIDTFCLCKKKKSTDLLVIMFRKVTSAFPYVCNSSHGVSIQSTVPHSGNMAYVCDTKWGGNLTVLFWVHS